MLQKAALSPFCDIGSISLRVCTTVSFKVPSYFHTTFISTPLRVLLCNKPKPREQNQGQNICVSLGFHLFPHACGYWLQLCAYKIRLLYIVSTSALTLSSAAFVSSELLTSGHSQKAAGWLQGLAITALISASQFESSLWQTANKHCYHLMVAWGSEFRCCKCSSQKNRHSHCIRKHCAGSFLAYNGKDLQTQILFLASLT